MPSGVRPLPPALRLRWIVAAGVVLIVAFVGSSGYDAWRSYSSAARRHRPRTRQPREGAGRAGCARSFQAVDVSPARHRGLARCPRPTRRRRSESARCSPAAPPGLPQVRSLNIIDAQGILRYSSRPSAGARASSKSRTARPSSRNATALRRGLFVSEPIVDRGENRMAFVLSRRIDDGQGQIRRRRRRELSTSTTSSSSTAPSGSAQGARSTWCATTAR